MVISENEMGQHLTAVRERAGLKQNELAKRVTWSAAVLSRVESGERPLSTDELEALLTAIGTDEAQHLQKVVTRQWETLRRPPIGHPDQDLLWQAESALNQLSELADKRELKSVFVRRLDEYRQELTSTAELLLSTEHHVAFIGSIGVGKSTAICRVTGLEVSGPTINIPSPVLEAGGGGVTLCEVHVRQGPEFGLIIEPRSDEEIRLDVSNFAELLMIPGGGATTDVQDQLDSDSVGVSKEIVRAIRNMTKLTTTRNRGPDGIPVRRDPAKELAATFSDVKSLAVEILTQMNLHQRDRHDIWYSQASGKEPLLWLKDTFEDINNCRHPEFTLPSRIDVVVPQPILNNDSLSIELIDTKGIDQTAERADLERHFHEAHTVSILCSAFNEAPAVSAQQLLKRMVDGGVRNIPEIAGILALPRPLEALAIKDQEGYVAETTSVGYELKAEEIEMALQNLGTPDLKVQFFNAREDDPDTLREFILGRVEALRESHRGHLVEAIQGASALVKNFEFEQVQEIQRDAARRLAVWLTTNGQLPLVSVQLNGSLMQALSQIHASTISASVRRTGAWPNLEYSHQLGYGGRRVAAVAVGTKLDEFKAIAQNLLQDPELTETYRRP